MSKKLNIIEASNMPIGTEFKVKYKDLIDDSNISIKGGSGGTKIFIWDDGERLALSDRTLKATFIPIQQSVSFMEAIANDKNRVKVILNDKNFCSGDVKVLSNYMSIRKLFKELNERFSDYGISKAIKEGKWYIEESEELEDERLS